MNYKSRQIGYRHCLGVATGRVLIESILAIGQSRSTNVVSDLSDSSRSLVRAYLTWFDEYGKLVLIENCRASS